MNVLTVINRALDIMQCCSPVFNTSAAGTRQCGVSAARFSVRQPAGPRRRTDAMSPGDSTHVDAGCEMTLPEESAVLPATLCRYRVAAAVDTCLAAADLLSDSDAGASLRHRC